jgi:uncharacterized protein (TIGR02391 family)
MENRPFLFLGSIVRPSDILQIEIFVSQVNFEQLKLPNGKPPNEEDDLNYILASFRRHTTRGVSIITEDFITSLPEGVARVLKPDNLDKIKIENLNEKDTAERLFDNLITHQKIRQASQNHFKNEEYRPAVLDAMISLEVMIKEKAKFPADNKGKELSGVPLMHKVFDSDNPILSWCEDKHQIDRDELEGYKHIFAGAMQGIRDPKAHAIFQISPMRALKLLTLATLLAELVDASKYVEQNQRTDKRALTTPYPTQNQWKRKIEPPR